MRWERLFADLEASAAETDRLVHGAEVADRTRRERARVQLADRLLAAEGSVVDLRVTGVGHLRGTVHRVGGQWVLLATDAAPPGEVLVPAGVILTAAGLGRRAVTRSPSSVASRLGLGHVLRGMSRDRSVVTATLVDGHRFTGTIDGVGADHLDITASRPGEPPDPGTPRTPTVVPFRALATLSRTV